MKIIKEILGRVFALWAALIFIITLVPIGLITWAISGYKDPERTAIFLKISRVWIRIYFFLIGSSITIRGVDNFEKDKNYIIICNHNSLMDILVITPFIPGANKTIAKSELAKIPLFGYVYKTGSILVNRKDKNSRSLSFKSMIEVLNAGMHMCIYPEGTRNKTTQPLKEFHNGAFKLAYETKKAILPAIILNTKKAMPADKVFFFWPTPAEVHFLPPVEVENHETADDLKRKCHELMWDYYLAHNPS
ncbi:MAG: lysophospholipid acyltransferase family protein [Ginsengibacter sp.]